MSVNEGNSNYEKRVKAEEEAIKPTCIVKGEVKQQKKTLGKKISEFFFETNGKDVLHYVVEDVIQPRVRDLLYDIVVGTADAKIYGRGSKSSSSSSSYERNDYENRFKNKNRNNWNGAGERRRRGSGFDLEEWFEDKLDALDVLNAMKGRINQFGMTTVGDYYDFIGKSAPGEYTTADFGWENLDGATVRHKRDGFYIDLPRPIRLD